MRFDSERITVLPFFEVYSPKDIVEKAEFTSSFTSTATDLKFGTDTTSFKRLFRLALLKEDVLDNDADVAVVVTVGLDSGIRSGDSDPKFLLSDGSTGLGFDLREEADRCRGMQATMGTTYSSAQFFPGAGHSSTILPEQFVLTIKPSQQWGSCYNSVDSGVISPVAYTRTINLDQGLWLEVYRENTNEQYVFNYITVEIHESLC